MGYEISAGQQAQLDYSLAQAEAIGSRSEAQVEFGTQLIKEGDVLEDQLDSLDSLARQAQQQDNSRRKKGGIGGFIGGVLGFMAAIAIPGGSALAKAAKVLLPGLGRQAGKAIAGGFKNVDVGDLDPDIQGQLVLQKRKGKKLEDAYSDFENAIDDLNDSQKQQAFMEFGIDAVMGLSNLKYDGLKVEGGETLGELRQAGKEGLIDYKYKDYLKDIANITVLGGEGSRSTLDMLSQMEGDRLVSTAQSAVEATNKKVFEEIAGLNQSTRVPFETTIQGLDIDEVSETLNLLTGQQPQSIPTTQAQQDVTNYSSLMGVQGVDVTPQSAFRKELSKDFALEMFDPQMLEYLENSYNRIPDDFRRQFPNQSFNSPKEFFIEFLQGGNIAQGTGNRSEYYQNNWKRYAQNYLQNTPTEMLSPDLQAYKAALDPNVNNMLGKELYEKRGIGQWATADKVEQAFRSANPSFTGAINSKTVTWEQIQPYFSQFESSGNPLAINLNNDGTLDFGVNQMNSKFLNSILDNFKTSVIDGRPDQVYLNMQDMLKNNLYAGNL
tara:strand:- start:1149 stop:2801 length:1653 start_codon:yes stop_codon:yes gene_type:complete